MGKTKKDKLKGKLKRANKEHSKKFDRIWKRLWSMDKEGNFTACWHQAKSSVDLILGIY